MFGTLSLGLLYFTTHLVCLVSSQECNVGESPSQNCGSMSTISCIDQENIEVLLKDTIRLTCTIGSLTPTFSILRTSCNSEIHELIENGANYSVNDNTLTILSAGREDEGKYFCSNDASMTNRVPIACVYISGFAQFMTCDLGTPAAFSYSRDSILIISRMNSCYQTLNVTEGQVTLDTRLMFMEGSCCGCRERVERFAVRFDRRDAEEEYVCNEANILCTSQNNVVVSRQSNEAFDFMLKVNLAGNDIVRYIYIEIEVDRPRSTETGVFWKVFEITVNQGLTILAPTAVFTTLTTPTSSATTMSSSPIDNVETTRGPDKEGPIDNVETTRGPDTEGPNDYGTSNQSAAGPAIGAAVVIIVIIAGVVILAAVLLSRRHGIKSKNLTSNKEKEVFYETIDIVKLPPTTQAGEVHIYRESVYNFDSHQQLELHLESKVCAKV